MTYLNFFKSIGITTKISWNFCKDFSMDDDKMNMLLSNIAFSFFSKDEKKVLYNMILKKELSDSKAMRINFLIEEEFENIFKKYPIKKTIIEKFVSCFLDWIEVSCITIDNIIIDNIYKKIKTNNVYFWYILSTKLFDKLKYNESLYLIDKIKDLFIDNNLFEDLLKLESKVIKKLDYFNNKKLLDRLCKLSKEVTFFKYDKIILELECHLLKNKPNFFNKIKFFYDSIEKFDVDELLNIYELSILSESEESIKLIYNLLIVKNIFEYDSLDEYNIFLLLESLKNKNFSAYEVMKNKMILDNAYDFKHINWYLNKKKC